MTIHPDDTYDGGRLCPDVTTEPGGHQRECCCYRCDPPDYDLRLCGACGTELGRFEHGSFCFDCQGARR